MKIFLAYGVFASLLLYIEAENCDKLGVLIYEDLACKPKNPSVGGGCPSGFDCEEAIHPKRGRCHLGGKQYKIGEKIADDLTYPVCRTGCVCTDTTEGPRFECDTEINCPELQTTLASLDSPDCYWKYELGKCCSVGIQCSPFDESIVCNVDGIPYRDGQKFTPQGTCLDCVCQKGFNGTFVEPFCRRKTCNVELTSDSYGVVNKCAPAYLSKEKVLCCPSFLACHAPEYKKLELNSEGTAEKSCTFREKIVRGNEKFPLRIADMEELECKCIMPPLVTCTPIAV